MAKYISFDNLDGSTTLVQVDAEEVAPVPGLPIKAGLADRVGEVVKAASNSLQEVLASAISSNAQALHIGVQKISPPPTEVEISFALKVTGELSNVAVGKIGSDANYTIKLVWKNIPDKTSEKESTQSTQNG